MFSTGLTECLHLEPVEGSDDGELLETGSLRA